MLKQEYQKVSRVAYLVLSSIMLLSACGETASDQLSASINNTEIVRKYSLFVASGLCYAGGASTSAGSGTIAAFDPRSGHLRRVVVDYSTYSPGDMPVSVIDYDTKHLLVTVENTSGRRLDLVAKDGSSVTTYLTNSSALSGVLRATKALPDGSLLVSKSTAIEKFTPAKSRVLQGANPFISAPASVCGTTTAMITSVESLPNGKILYTHAAASPNNKLNIISSSGYASTADCLTSQAAPSALAMPTSSVLHSSGKLLVTYGSTTLSQNSVYSYTINAVTNAITTPVAAFSDATYVNGPSALTEDAQTSDVFVASSQSAFNTIERFHFDTASGTLSRSNEKIGPNVYTRCVTAMKVAGEP